ncbi:DUF4112 domain-containing protein [Indioceanicola profundi]|uniref:DUF4112 domain-containing protein n=1 Tax=Indioceanicola profundi TaxID=2220096 RepID=UPI000E6ACC73|nr:DUF4112 domain-containing protein [Indioceanicola profundi]
MRRPPKALDPVKVAELRNLADLLDSRWRVPGTDWRFGVDGVASIIPGLGDTATGVVGAYIIWQAARIGVPRSTLVRMAANVGVDWAVGSIPVLGTIFDFAFKSNQRNMRLLNQHLDTFESMEAERYRK